MVKDKYDFILDLIENKKLNTSQKERVLRLAVLEAKKEGEKKDTEFLKRLEELEKEIKGDNNHGREINKQKRSPSRPKETFELLSHFSDQEGGMKNLTHAFNSNHIAYEDLIKQCKEEFEAGKKRFQNVPAALLKRIEEFAFSENPSWFIMRGEEKIVKKIGWSDPVFVKWYKENQIHPANDSYYNSEMIVPFKETIQVRSDSGNLIKLLDELSEKVFQKSVKLIINDSIKSAQFYTDVDRLGSAIYHIFCAIKQASLKNFCDEVEIDYKVDNGVKIIRIVHIDSEPTKSVHDVDFLGGDLGNVMKNLWSLCNYDIWARFKEGEYRKVILS